MKNANIIKLDLLLGGVIGIIALYFFTPLSDYLEIDRISELASDVPDNASLLYSSVFALSGAHLR